MRPVEPRYSTHEHSFIRLRYFQVICNYPANCKDCGWNPAAIYDTYCDGFTWWNGDWNLPTNWISEIRNAHIYIYEQLWVVWTDVKLASWGFHTVQRLRQIERCFLRASYTCPMESFGLSWVAYRVSRCLLVSKCISWCPMLYLGVPWSLMMGSCGCFMVTVMFPGFSYGVGWCLLVCYHV